MDRFHHVMPIVLEALFAIPKVRKTANFLNAKSGEYKEFGQRISGMVPVIGDTITFVFKWGIGRKALSKTQKASFLVKGAKKKGTNILNSVNGLVKDGARRTTPYHYEQACECVKEKGKKYFGKGKCFTGDTLIYTEQGYVPIVDIHEGDLVWSMEEETGETGLKRVEAVFCTGAHTIHEIEVEGNKLIRTTAYHPFYVAQQGWVDAINLQKGNILVTADGIAEITGVSKCRYDDAVKTYNFHVEDWTSYFVTEQKIYVHNPIGEHEELFQEMHQGELVSVYSGEVSPPVGMAIPIDRIPDLANGVVKVLEWGMKVAAGVAAVILAKPETPVLNRGEAEALRKAQRKIELEKKQKQQAENAAKEILKLNNPSAAELRSVFERNGFEVNLVSDKDILYIAKLIKDAQKEPESKQKENKGKGQTKGKSKTGDTSKHVPKTGDWRSLGKKKGQWLKEKGYEVKPRKQQGNNKGGAGQSISDVYDSNGNNIGRIDKGFKVDGKIVPEHFHSNSDTTNIHYYFSD